MKERCTPAATTATPPCCWGRPAGWRSSATSTAPWSFIFQPAEESEGGAAVMIEDGLFEKFPVDAVYGLHNWPGIPLGEMAIMPGPVMAGTCAFEIAIRGHGCHAAMPHQGVDPIVAGSQLVQALQTVVSRTLHPCESAVVSVTPVPRRLGLEHHSRRRYPARQPSAPSSRKCRKRWSGPSSAWSAASPRRQPGPRSASPSTHRYPPTVNSGPETEVCRHAARAVLGPRAGHHRRPALHGRRRLRLHAAGKSPAATSGWATAPAPAAAPCTTPTTTSTTRPWRWVFPTGSAWPRPALKPA